MLTNRQLVSLIARRVPQIWDAIDPHGRSGSKSDAAALNPQPLPPRDLAALNPQPLPPVAAGAAYGRQVVQLAWTADKLGQKIRPVSEWDGFDGVGFPVPVDMEELLRKLKGGSGEPPPRPNWLREYMAGVVLALSEARGSSDADDFLTDAVDRALDVLTELDREIPA